MTVRFFALVCLFVAVPGVSSRAQSIEPNAVVAVAESQDQSGRVAAQPPRPQLQRGQPQPVPAPAPQPPRDAPPAATPPVAPPVPTPRPRPENQSTNVRIDLTVTDERPGATPIKKTVSIVTGDGLNGSVRSQTNYQTGNLPGTAPFNVDAMPVILADGKVHMRLTLQYDVVPPLGAAQGEPQPVRLLGTSIRDSMALILENNKPLVVVQSSDPVSDRKVSVDVRATILK